MNTKTCTICKEVKNLSDFHKDKNRKSGVIDKCKSCVKNYHRSYYLINKKKINNQNKNWYIKNLDKIKLYQIINKDKIYKSHKDRHEAHPEIRKNYERKNRKRITINHNNYQKLQRKININFKIKDNLRRRVNTFLNQNTKSKRTMQLIGCSIEFLKKHLESQFKEGMSWSNYGRGWNGKGMQEWHIDHIIPCSSFDLIDLKQQNQCFHYSNLQPFWAEDNIRKGNRYEK